MQNHLGELWSLFDFLAPGFLGGQKSFKSRYRTPIEKHGDIERQDLLNRRIRPFMLRRTKEEVITELPPKTEIVEPVEMETNAARDLRGDPAVDACQGAGGDSFRKVWPAPASSFWTRC